MRHPLLTLVLAGAIVAPFASTTFAADATTQPTHHRREGQGQRGELFAKLKERLASLDLTADQQKQIDSILEDARAQVKAARESAGGDKEQMRQKMQEIMQDTRQKIAGVLTPEQKQKFKEETHKK